MPVRSSLDDFLQGFQHFKICVRPRYEELKSQNKSPHPKNTLQKAMEGGDDTNNSRDDAYLLHQAAPIYSCMYGTYKRTFCLSRKMNVFTLPLSTDLYQLWGN